MKTAIFGASGFVGRNMVESFTERDLEFVASDVIESPFSSEIEYQKCDILKLDEVKKIIEDVDVVIHLAASPLNVSIEKPLLNTEINIGGTLNLMEASRAAGVEKFIFSSASSLVGEVQYYPVDEKHPCTPKTPYGVAKYAIENYLRVYNEIYGMNYLVFRFFNLYGRYQYPQSRALIPMVYERLTKGMEFTIFGDGSATHDFIYIEDVIDFYLKAITDKSEVKNEIVNMGTGVGTSILEIVNTSAKILGVKPNLKFQPKKPGEIENFTADVKKLKILFGVVPKITVTKGLEITFKWLNSIK